MEDIRLYDFEFNLLAIAHDFTSSNWSLKYNDIGTFEAHFPLTSKVVGVVFNHKYLVAVQGEKQAIITSIQANAELVLYGRTVNWILLKRVIPDFNQLTGNVETLACGFVADAFDDVTSFEVQNNSLFTTAITFWRNTYHPVSEVVRDCLARDGGGHEVWFDVINKKWIYRALNGVERLITLSEGNRNGYDGSYTENALDYFTTGFYQVQSEGDEPTSVWHEIVSDSAKTGMYRWEGIVSAGSESEAKSEMEKKIRKIEMSMTANELFWGEHYNLGDVITVQMQFDDVKIANKKRIIGVDVWFEPNNVGERPILGELFEEVEEN